MRAFYNDVQGAKHDHIILLTTDELVSLRAILADVATSDNQQQWTERDQETAKAFGRKTDNRDVDSFAIVVQKSDGLS